MRIPAYGKNNPALSLNKVPGCFYYMPSVFFEFRNKFSGS